MTPNPSREKLPPPPEETRIRGRLRGLETLWTLDRFTEVIRGEVQKGIERAWPEEQIRSWIRTAFDLAPQSMTPAGKAIDSVLRTFGRKPPEERVRQPPFRFPGQTRRPPSQGQ